MRKIKYIIIFILTILSCTNNDEPETTRKCLANDTLLNTLWIGNGDRYGEIITFYSKNQYNWDADWGNKQGVFCFDGTDGNFDEAIRFKISGSVLTLNSNDQGGTGTFERQ